MEFFKAVGKVALGTRVRSLGDLIGKEATEIYKAYETSLQSKWFPVFYILSKNERCSVTSIAESIGHSHASVSKTLGEMGKADLIVEKPDPKDRRRTWIRLSKKGTEVARKIEGQYIDVEAAIADISAEASHDLWAALEEWEFLLSQKSMLKRVLDHRKRRESSTVEVVDFQPKYREAFRELNREWITTYFKMEKPDIEALDQPKKYILDRGGFIFVALMDQKPVGVCALIPHKKKVYELAKMAVSPEARGKHIGFLLGDAAIQKAKAMKADKVYLESNTILKPAISLYHKLGFKKIVGPPTPYERCNIQMELELGS